MKFTKTHEWIKVEENIGTVGITNHAQEELSDIVHIDLPEIGKKVKAGESLIVVESVKAASDIYAPAAGEVVEVNSNLSDAPEMVNEDAENKGWLVKIKLTNLEELDSLLEKEEYKKLVV